MIKVMDRVTGVEIAVTHLNTLYTFYTATTPNILNVTVFDTLTFGVSASKGESFVNILQIRS